MSNVSLPSPHDMRSIIKRLIANTKLNPNAHAFLISSRWFNSWKTYVDYYETEQNDSNLINDLNYAGNFSRMQDDNASSSRFSDNMSDFHKYENEFGDFKIIDNPSKTMQQHKFKRVLQIDNNSLLVDGSVKPDLKENEDYEIVTEAVYNKLHSWYGGGPQIKCNVEFNEVKNDIEVVVREPQFDVYFKDQKKSFSFSRNKPIELFKNNLCTFFHVKCDQTRLCDYCSKCRLTELKNDKTFAYYSLDNGSLILLEEKLSDGSWPNLSKTKSSSFWSIMDPCTPGMHGLENTGNSCYLNSSLQCMIHTKSLIDFFVNNTSNFNIILQSSNSKYNSNNRRLSESFFELMKYAWTDGIPSFPPRFLKGVISELFPKFAGNDQQDAHELLTFLLCRLHEELNSSFSNGNNEHDFNLINDKPWRKFKRCNDSIIADSFYGMFKSQIKCPNCDEVQYQYDPFMSLSLPIPVELQRTPPFLFVPWDLKSPRIKMQLSLSSPNAVMEANIALSHMFKRNMIVIFAEHNYNSIDLRWLDRIEPSSRDCRIVAFELPQFPDSINQNTNHFLKNSFNPNTITSNMPFDNPQTSQNMTDYNQLPGLFAQVRCLASVMCCGHIRQSDIDSFVLIYLPSPNCTLKEVQMECDKRFNCLFQPCKGDVISPHIKDIIKNLVKSEHLLAVGQSYRKVFDGVWQKTVAKIAARPYENNVKFDRDPLIPYATRRRIDLKFNPDVIRDQSQFEWTAVGNVLNQIETQIEPQHHSNSTFSLQQCLNLFVNEEILDFDNQFFCNSCGKKVCAIKKMEIYRPPKYLIIHFKRFMNNPQTKERKKITTKAYYPDIIDMSPYLSNDEFEHEDEMFQHFGEKEVTSTQYKLYAIVEHVGNLDSGHFVTLSKVNDDNQWFKFNDNMVQKIKKNKIHTTDAYLLFYERM